MFHHSTALPLPGLLHDRLDRAATDLIGNGAMKIDFSQPTGEPALVPAASVSWIVFKNQISMFIGGVTAVLLEFAEPKVRDGVWQHSSFRADALTRLQRTGLAAMVTVYGAHSQAEAMIAGVVRRHGKVEGQTSGGEAYNANDPDLLDWVQATAGFGFMEAYHQFVRPLSDDERDALFLEAGPAAKLYGATGAPTSQAELDALFAFRRDRLEPSPIVAEFLGIMRDLPALPGPVRPLQGLLVKAAVELLPHWIRHRLELGSEWSLNRLERATVRLAARSADRLLLRSSPPVQACRRLGLPDDYLYRPIRR
ncbi:oxygenase MpaB family protein [Rhizobium panacihumi]|uniref:oxygenase MpaB family protein n=1 Tax=Rhizobium panacihumi TaxID=2008450 RepID=UPI003D7B493C